MLAVSVRRVHGLQSFGAAVTHRYGRDAGWPALQTEATAQGASDEQVRFRAVPCRLSRHVGRNDMEAVILARFAVIKVGKALSVDDLVKKPAPRGRKPNPRDEDLAKLVNEVSSGPESQVIPWEFEGKVATARLAASRVIKSTNVRVFVSSRPDYPGRLLFSRVPLSGRQSRRG